jgi:hypothetical protein
MFARATPCSREISCSRSNCRSSQLYSTWVPELLIDHDNPHFSQIDVNEVPTRKLGRSLPELYANPYDLAREPTNYPFIVIALLALCSASFTGCGARKITDYQPASPSASERTAQQSGVEVALDPFVESERTKEYFDINANAAGIAILHVRVLNKTHDQTFLVEKKNFQLSTNGDAKGLTGDGKNIERSKATGTTVALVGDAAALVVPALGFPVAMEGAAMISHASEVQRNFVSKEMADQTLSVGQSMEGFIYFTPVEKDRDWTRATTVEISLTEIKTHRIIEFNIPLS